MNNTDRNTLHLQDISSSALIAKSYSSGFELSNDVYNSISYASNGKIYYVLSSESLDYGGKMYSYDPGTDKVHYLADLTEICTEAGQKSVPQGKCHVRFYESNGKLYFATLLGYYEMVEGAGHLPQNLPEGYKPYPGGHILSYDLSSGEFEDLAIAPHGQGFLAMTMDPGRGSIYAITWPNGYFIHYNINTGELKNLGSVSAGGEAGVAGEDYRVLCRSMLIDPKSGTVYLSTSEGDIFSYSPETESISKLNGVDLRLDYFGKYDPSGKGSMAYNWRKILWYQSEGVAYGVHGNSGYLFRFDPHQSKIEIVKRITSEPSQRSGMFDQFGYGYMGFRLGPDNTIYYLTGGPIYVDGKRVEGKDHIAMGRAKGPENLHLITYNIPDDKYIDHGPVFLCDGSRPANVNSIALDAEGNIYTIASFHEDDKKITDLIKIPNPFS